MTAARMQLLLLCLALPASLAARSAGPPVRRSAVPSDDGGLTCNACHRGADVNSDARGRFVVEARDYRPGVKQTIRVLLSHPEGARWGFQLTARMASNPSLKAGTFTQTSAIRVQCNASPTEGNCGDETEFASHNTTSTFTGESRAVWEVEWTPPATGAGDVIFYAAGNAANNGGTNAGDLIYNTTTTVKQQNCNLGKPTISAAGNAASGQVGTLAFNTLVAIVGSGFQPAGARRTIAAQDFANGRFPTDIACLAVELDTRRMPITYAQENQINAQLPTIGGSGQMRLVVIANPGLSNEQRSDPATIVLGNPSPAFFLFGGNNIAALLAGSSTIIANPANVSVARAARVGDVISLFATGLGATDPVYQAGEIPTAAVNLAQRPVIEWGGRAMDAADVLYVGLAPGLISGAYQINLRVPPYATPGAANAVRIRQGSSLSPENAFIFVAN